MGFGSVGCGGCGVRFAAKGVVLAGQLLDSSVRPLYKYGCHVHLKVA